MRTLRLNLTLAVAAVALAGIAPAAPFQADDNRKTSDDQKNNKADVELTAQIRKEIVGDKTLSTAAHNIKIISENGVVTIRGEVNSAEEKTAVVDIARRIAGAANVTDQVTVAPPKH